MENIKEHTVTVLCSSYIRSNFCKDIWEGVRQILVAKTLSIQYQYPAYLCQVQ